MFGLRSRSYSRLAEAFGEAQVGEVGKARRITLPKLRALCEERRRVFGYGRIPLKIPCALGAGSFI
ncbi:MAG: hypothetical protein COX90_00005 [Candidatus Nealsonbacteria bacterium CG_4_10_14_0_2_um_filter_38_17]|uniref:Uncharacterized protein n=2 Tax=Candidatus Nealsoniibacteriota TaxID=1817911 RepID=A0A2M7UZA9_9BACT|nr:MAG: hypothetical protein COX36_01910 [Candidatus Nealsonbacteria bacterium CG23_combo_of_CG06-09_8_20_14_all_38_19]PIZ89299.1 MAG: hypothetical protein COX90_00005 [Candidatus Nealsonbacteria bacterium CG_4_10_14_0_2_um_filter_38_17]